MNEPPNMNANSLPYPLSCQACVNYIFYLLRYPPDDCPHCFVHYLPLPCRFTWLFPSGQIPQVLLNVKFWGSNWARAVFIAPPPSTSHIIVNLLPIRGLTKWWYLKNIKYIGWLDQSNEFSQPLSKNVCRVIFFFTENPLITSSGCSDEPCWMMALLMACSCRIPRRGTVVAPSAQGFLEPEANCLSRCQSCLCPLGLVIPCCGCMCTDIHLPQNWPQNAWMKQVEFISFILFHHFPEILHLHIATNYVMRECKKSYH